ncbi:MAG: type II toxin-antitoxin system HicB family antitoxin [Elusimicrobiota bacterium]
MKIRDVIALIRKDGWRLVRLKGSHRYAEQHLQTSGTEMNKYLVVIERAGSNFSAFCPDLPGCVATGKTRVEANKNLRQAIALHLDGLQEDGVTPPHPHSSARYVRVKVRKPARRAAVHS